MTMLMGITIRFNVAGCLCAAVLWCMLLLTAPPAVAADMSSDEFLTGYVTSILERDLQWEKDSYRVQVTGGVATITLFTNDPARREAAEERLRNINGLKEMTVVVSPTTSGKPGSFLGITNERKAFPVGDLFRPLIADPKQPLFFISVYRYNSTVARYTVASFGVGETLGLYRFQGLREGDGLQLNLEGAIFSQFNLSTHSYNLINADYLIGLPATYRYGVNSLRFNLYHQSSHLGDELLLSANPPTRVNLSYEAVQLVYSLELGDWRGYGGGEFLIQKEPSNLKRGGAQWGIEYRGTKRVLWNGLPIAGVDMKSFEEHNWAVDTSAKVGLQFGQSNIGKRRMRLMAVWFNGYDPRGQFYTQRIYYYGMEVSLGF